MFTDFTPEGSQKRPHVSIRRKKIAKPPHDISILRLD